MHSKGVTQYLQKYAEPCVIDSDAFFAGKTWEYAVVLPCFNENTGFLERLTAHTHAPNILLICVLNEPDTHAENDTNKTFKHRLEQQTERITHSERLNLRRWGQLHIVLSEHCGQHALPAQQGVGLARKIGADFAARWILEGTVKKPWIFSCDADAHLPDNYFDLGPLTPDTSACVFEFKHIGGTDAVTNATQIYERCLYYFRDQLQRAGSPYAYHSLGSSMALSAKHYCQARGYPKRSAAEDFYLLNKLAKLGGIASLPEITVNIEARLSDRVPFGTGPSVAKILEKQQAGLPITYYNPAIFEQLQQLLKAWKPIWTASHAGQDWQSHLPPHCRAALAHAGFEAFLLKRLDQDKNANQFHANVTRWFDAFQTLKFIKYLQTHAFADLALEKIL